MHCNHKIIKIGEKLRSQYLYNIYNEADIVTFMINKFNDNKQTTNKILKILN